MVLDGGNWMGEKTKSIPTRFHEHFDNELDSPESPHRP